MYILAESSILTYGYFGLNCPMDFKASFNLVARVCSKYPIIGRLDIGISTFLGGNFLGSFKSMNFQGVLQEEVQLKLLTHIFIHLMNLAVCSSFAIT